MKKKIGIIVPDLGGGGAEKVALLLSNYLSKKYQVTLLLYKKKGFYLDYVDNNVIIKELNIDHKKIFKIPILLFQLFNFCKNKDVVFCGFQLFTEFFVLIATFFCKKVKVIPVIQTSVSVLLKKKKFFNFFTKTIISLLYNLFPCIICSSEGVRDDLKKYFKVSEKRTFRIFNPVYFFEENIVKRINRLYERPLFITMARLSYEKRIDVMLKAWYLYKKDNNPGTLIILGDGPLKNELEDYCEEKEISSSVIFKGFTKNIQSELKDSDIFLLSSDFEGFGNVIVEAMYYSLPVISTDCPYGPREILADGNFGVLVGLENSEEMAHSMKKMILDKELFFKYKRLSKLRVKDFDIERIMEQYEIIIQRL